MSARTVATEARSGEATAKWRNSSSLVTTRSRRRSPDRRSILGADSNAPHSTASGALGEEPEVNCLWNPPADLRTGDEPRSLRLALRESDQTEVGQWFIGAEPACRTDTISTCCDDWPKAQSDLRKNAANVGTLFLSWNPDLALSERRTVCAASICRATLSLPCFVDSRTERPAT